MNLDLIGLGFTVFLVNSVYPYYMNLDESDPHSVEYDVDQDGIGGGYFHFNPSLAKDDRDDFIVHPPIVLPIDEEAAPPPPPSERKDESINLGVTKTIYFRRRRVTKLPFDGMIEEPGELLDGRHME